ncbi:MAG: shikimate dehydrogenase family protein [Solirubrobacterales bacterium]
MPAKPITITGRTTVLGVIGDPLVQAASPAMINRELSSRGEDAVLVPLGTHEDQLASMLDGLRSTFTFGGAVVTMPHKQAVLALLDHLTPRAEELQAVNVIRRSPHGELTGDMLDGVGFLAGLKPLIADLEGKRVLVVGAGGAASAIAFACARAGADLGVVNRTSERAELLAHRMQVAGLSGTLVTNPTSEWDVVVNATRVGLLADDGLPVAEVVLASQPIVSDIVMTTQPDTALLRAAAAAGCTHQDGRPMLQGQVRLMIEFMLG